MVRLLLLLCAVLASCTAQCAEVSSPRYSVIASDNGKIVRFDRHGNVVWEYSGIRQVHTLQQLDNGHLLCQQDWQTIVEITPDSDIVWSYDATGNGNAGRRLEVHAFQRLDDGLTMIVENGIGRVIEVDAAGTIQHSLRYQVDPLHAHSDVRMGHRLNNGHYLLAHEKEGRVTEYDRQGNVVWDYDVPLFSRERRRGHGPEAFGNQVYNALRLPNGNTLIATGNGHSVLEVTPDKDIVWQLHQHDLPGITLAWVTSLEVLPNGNILVGNCHAGPENPQFIEVSRDKQVIWTFRDFEVLGNSVAVSATVGVKDVLR